MKDTIVEKKTERKTYIDLIKIIAILLVLFNHTGIHGYVLFVNRRESALYWFYMVTSVLAKMNIPLFLMASGALLLKKEESIKKLLTKRFVKYVLILFGISIVSYLYSCFRLKSIGFSVSYFFKTLYGEEIYIGYWYLYLYLAYILMLPFLRRMAQGMKNSEFNWMVVTFALMDILSVVDFLIWKDEVTHNTNFTFFNTLFYVFYPMMGYYIEERLTEKDFNKRNFGILILLSVLVILTTCLLTNYRCTINNFWTEPDCQRFFNTLIFIPTITVFYGLKWLFMKHPLSNKKSNVISTMGGTVFGIYLLEQILRFETERIFRYLSPKIGSFLAVMVWILSIFIIGFVLVFAFKKITSFFKKKKKELA